VVRDHGQLAAVSGVSGVLTLGIIDLIKSTDTHMDVEQLVIDDTLVRRLVTTQFPQWSDLSVRPVALGGWDNRTFHLGEHMLVRMPSAADYAVQVEREHRWLPRLAPLLPLPIPAPLAIGEPADGYPWGWSIYHWLEGDTAAPERIADLRDFATSLAQFLIALQRIDPTGGPPPGPTTLRHGRRSPLWRAGSMSTPQPRSGKRRLRPPGTVLRCGSTATSAPATCWCKGAG
jgi:hypothetical protein